MKAEVYMVYLRNTTMFLKGTYCVNEIEAYKIKQKYIGDIF
jgi:hypothetical protein